MTNPEDKPQGIRIGKLSELTGVSRDTIKFYLKEGLIPRPVKTGRTMAYYDPSCVERIRLIKRLQDERFLPLRVIRGVLESQNAAIQELSLVEAFQGLSVFPDPVTEVSLAEVRLKTGYTDEDIQKIEKAGLIGPRRDAPGKEFTTLDLRIMSLIRQRERAGFSLDYSLEMMAIYRDAIAQVVTAGTRKFATSADIDVDSETMVQNVRQGEQALIAFMPLIRARLAHDYLAKTSIQFEKIPERVIDIFHFRSLRTGDPDSGIHDVSRWLLASADGLVDDIRQKAVLPLIDGIQILIDRKPDAALKAFEPFLPHPIFGPVAAPLMGFAYLMRAAGADSHLQGIREFRTAVSFLDRQQQPDLQKLIDIAGLYLQSTGLAVIPDPFDTHRKAAAMAIELCRGVEAVTKGRTNKRLTGLLRELRAKTQMVIAAMYRYDEDLPQAAGILKDMEQDRTIPPFYLARARQAIADLKE